MAATSYSSSEAYWDAAAETYDRDFTGTLIGQTRRLAVWRRLDRIFEPGQRILELNCGTGIDAVHLAARGVQITACDISPRMIQLARQLATKTQAGCRIDFRVLPTENIDALESERSFDGAFSNFSGLNCVADLSTVTRHLASLLKPGAPVFVCMMGRFVPWEILWFLAHGNVERALRRVRSSSDPRVASALTVQHPSVNQIAHLFAPGFRMRRWTGIGIAVPPSYMESWARRFSKITKSLAELDRCIGRFPPFRNMADQVLLEFERTETAESP